MLKKIHFTTILCSIIVFSVVAGLVAYYYISDPKRVIENQLISLKKNKVASAYSDFTSQEFQAATSLRQFQEFVSDHPQFRSFTTLHMDPPKFQGDQVSTGVVLEDELGDRAELIFELVKENYLWKVLAIRFNSLAEQGSLTGGMLAPIEAQLKALKRSDILDAYNHPSTNDFLEHTSFEDFKAFVLANPLLTQFDQYTYKRHLKEGDEGHVLISLNPEVEGLQLEYHVKKEGDNQWKIQYMHIVSDASSPTPDQQLGSDQLISTIKDLLEVLKKKDYLKVYDDYISARIKKTTSEEKFETFFKNVTAFSSYQSLKIKEPYLENTQGLVGVDLITEEGTTSVEFSLRVEDHSWKITGIHVEKSVETQSTEDSSPPGFKSRDLITALQSFLNALQHTEINTAYVKFTSERFKEAQSFDQFKEFIQLHGELTKGTSSSFEKIALNNNIATITGKIFLSNSLFLPVEFDLIQEPEGKWKILHIFTFPLAHQPTSTQENTSSSLSISKIMMGTHVTSEGEILDATTTLKLPVDDIYINIFIKNGMPGNTLTTVLRHITSGSEMAPITVSATEKGGSRLSLVFSPPPKGWPIGSYQIRVNAGSETKSFNFTIE